MRNGPYRVGSRAGPTSRMLSHSSRDSRIMRRASQRSGLYKNSAETHAPCPSGREVCRNEGGSGPDRRGGLQHDAATCEVEVVVAQGKDIAVVQSVGSEAEHEDERGAFLQQPREEPGVRPLLRIRPVRRDHDLAQLRRKAAPREVERQESARLGEFAQVFSFL